MLESSYSPVVVLLVASVLGAERGNPHAPAAPDTDGDDTVADGRDAE